MKKDYVASVAEQLIAQLEAGTAPWVKPWRPGARFMPFNPITGKDYRGMNAVILLMTAEAFGYGDARWMTYRQAASQDGQVRRGEKSTLIQYWKWREERPVIGPDGAPLTDDEKRPFALICRPYLAAMMPDFEISPDGRRHGGTSHAGQRG